MTVFHFFTVEISKCIMRGGLYRLGWIHQNLPADLTRSSNTCSLWKSVVRDLIVLILSDVINLIVPNAALFWQTDLFVYPFFFYLFALALYPIGGSRPPCPQACFRFFPAVPLMRGLPSRAWFFCLVFHREQTVS